MSDTSTMVSAGCTNCYAMGLAATRLKNHPSREGLTRKTGGRDVWTGEVRFNEQWLTQPLQWSRPRMIFVCAHGDLFHESVPDEWIDKVFAVMALAPPAHLPGADQTARAGAALLGRAHRRHDASRLGDVSYRATHGEKQCRGVRLAPANVWLGTSVEDEVTAHHRIPLLLDTPAAKRFLSAEPMLGPIDISVWIGPHFRMTHIQRMPDFPEGSGRFGRLSWVICGGESGRNARPMHPQWARDLRDQCVAAGVAFFFKQNGEWVSVSEVAGPGEHFRFPDGATVRRTGKKLAGRTLDGRTWDEVPV